MKHGPYPLLTKCSCGGLLTGNQRRKYPYSAIAPDLWVLETRCRGCSWGFEDIYEVPPTAEQRLAIGDKHNESLSRRAAEAVN